MLGKRLTGLLKHCSAHMGRKAKEVKSVRRVEARRLQLGLPKLVEVRKYETLAESPSLQLANRVCLYIYTYIFIYMSVCASGIPAGNPSWVQPLASTTLRVKATAIFVQSGKSVACAKNFCAIKRLSG